MEGNDLSYVMMKIQFDTSFTEDRLAIRPESLE